MQWKIKAHWKWQYEASVWLYTGKSEGQVYGLLCKLQSIQSLSLLLCPQRPRSGRGIAQTKHWPFLSKYKAMNGNGKLSTLSCLMWRIKVLIKSPIFFSLDCNGRRAENYWLKSNTEMNSYVTIFISSNIDLNLSSMPESFKKF